MKRLAMLATFALVMSTGVAMAYPCPYSNCAIDEPVVANPQGAPEPAPFQTAGPCPNPNCAIDEPVVTNPQRAPEPAPFQTADCSGC